MSEQTVPTVLSVWEGVKMTVEVVDGEIVATLDKPGMVATIPSGVNLVLTVVPVPQRVSEQFEQLGAHAYGQVDAKRVVPREVLVGHGKAAAEAWYRGWDAAATIEADKVFEEET